MSLACKADFPVFTHYPDLHYLDSAATTQKPHCVIDALIHCYEKQCAPVHLYELAAEASIYYEEARSTVARFINASTAEECVFTRSATESINMVAQGWARNILNTADEVWVSEMEHHSNYLPWQRVCKETGAQLRVVKVSKDGELLIDESSYYKNSVKLIVLTHVSNVLGNINPIAEIAEKAQRQGIPVLVDASQSVGHIPVDVQKINCTFMVFSAHKCYGPEGIGMLYGKRDYLEQCEPMLLGGGMVNRVKLEGSASSHVKRTTWLSLPARLEAGSPNLSGAQGFAAAINYVQCIGVDRLHSHTAELAKLTRSLLSNIDRVNVIGYESDSISSPLKTGIVSFHIDGIHPHDMAQVAADNNVAIRAGHHCAQPLMNAIGVDSTARVSFGAYNSENDIQPLVSAVETAIELFGR